MPRLNIEGQTLRLLPQKAMLWEETNTLILADLHLGKASHFRREGINISPGCGEKDLQVLKALLESHKPTEVLFLGDLFHSSLNKEWDIFCEYLHDFPEIKFRLLKGNHDILPTCSYIDAGLEVIQGLLTKGPFLFSHQPEKGATGSVNICGHIHPGVNLQGLAHQSLQLPCFYFENRTLFLPAFGNLTGLYIMKPTKKTQVYVVTGEKIISVEF
ncbi:ligase-associated DNA damage response endonuclease PdeM [Cytophagaceae bacterium ABcell3]|nr:ligase-associated DNA damage response endonuclease PdeM [Cytophagaceae bacterium ABcell3]